MHPAPQSPALHTTVGPFESLVKNASDMFSVINPAGVVLYASPSVERLTGYRADEYVGQDGSWWIHPDDRKVVRRAVLASMRSPEQVMRLEVRFLCLDGNWIDLDTYATNLLDDPSVGGIVLNSRDISDRKRAEARLRETEARYRILIEQMPVVSYVMTDGDENEILFFSPQSVDVFGYTPEELIARSDTWLEDIHPDDRERVWRSHVETNLTGERYDLEYRFRTPDCGYRWVRDIADAVAQDTDQGGTGRRNWQGVVIDITAQKESEQRLRDLQLRYQSLVEQLPLVTYTLANDAVQSPLYMSPRFETMFGIRRKPGNRMRASPVREFTRMTANAHWPPCAMPSRPESRTASNTVCSRATGGRCGYATRRS